MQLLPHENPRAILLGVVVLEILEPGVPVVRVAREGRESWCYQGEGGRWLPLTPADRRAFHDDDPWPSAADIIGAACPELVGA